MKTVLKQEWKASRKRIALVSLILASIMLVTILVNVLGYYSNSKHVSGFGTFLYIICLQIGTWGIGVFALIKGSGNLHTILFKDTNYLMLTVPKRSWVYLAGKQIINLIEYLIYAIPTAFYLSFLGPTGSFLFGNDFYQFYGNTAGENYWQSVKELYSWVFKEEFVFVLQICIVVVLLFVITQMFLNGAFAVYATLVKSKKKKRILMGLIIFFMFYIPMKVASYGVDSLGFKWEVSEIGMLPFWPSVGIMGIFAIVYYILASWLVEKKIEV